MNLYSLSRGYDIMDMIVIESGDQLRVGQRLATIDTRTGEIEILGRLALESPRISKTNTLALLDLLGDMYEITLREMGIRQTTDSAPFRSFVRTLLVPDELAKTLGF